MTQGADVVILEQRQNNGEYNYGHNIPFYLLQLF
jgi:hypothetical protein